MLEMPKLIKAWKKVCNCSGSDWISMFTVELTFAGGQEKLDQVPEINEPALLEGRVFRSPLTGRCIYTMYFYVKDICTKNEQFISVPDAPTTSPLDCSM